MYTQWLLVGGPMNGVAPMIRSDLPDITFVVRGIYHRYLRTTFVWDDRSYRVGVHISKDPHDVNVEEIINAITELGVKPT